MGEMGRGVSVQCQEAGVGSRLLWRISLFDSSWIETLTLSRYYTLNKPHNKLDVTIVEASAITEDGGIIPGASVGASPELIQMADKIIIEVNTAAPSFEGLHDITMTGKP